MEPEMRQVADFIQAHGGAPVQVGQGELLLPDGARIFTNGPMLYRPPDDSLKLARLKMTYAQVRLDDAVNANKNFWSMAANGGGQWKWDDSRLGPQPPEYGTLLASAGKDYHAEAAVKQRLKQMVADRRAAYDKAAEELAAVCPPELV